MTPHFWMDVDLAIEAVETIRDELSRLDPDGAEGYRERAERYIAELRAVDNEIAELLSGLPEERRHLVTFHDAYGYFAERYGLTILGFLGRGSRRGAERNGDHRTGGKHHGVGDTLHLYRAPVQRACRRPDSEGHGRLYSHDPVRGSE